MIDVHAHVLPKMDDGSKSVEESIEMLTQMYKSGVTTVVATPHFDMRKESVNEFLTRREESYQDLMAAMEGEGFPELFLGAEVLYCGVSLSRMDDVEKLCLGNGRCLLVETLNQQWDESFAYDMVRLMMVQNITPVLAHVERVIHKQTNRKFLKSLQIEGVITQGNAEYFLSRRSRRNALKMLKEETIQVLASDCHNLSDRKPNLADAMELIRNSFDEESVQALAINAERILFEELK